MPFKGFEVLLRVSTSIRDNQHEIVFLRKLWTLFSVSTRSLEPSVGCLDATTSVLEIRRRIWFVKTRPGFNLRRIPSSLLSLSPEWLPNWIFNGPHPSQGIPMLRFVKRRAIFISFPPKNYVPATCLQSLLIFLIRFQTHSVHWINREFAKNVHSKNSSLYFIFKFNSPWRITSSELFFRPPLHKLSTQLYILFCKFLDGSMKIYLVYRITWKTWEILKIMRQF